ncbi:Sensor histidine kinase YehU [compost metagenome]
MRDELNHARCYMAIQEYRQNFNIQYVEHIESELFDVIVPKVILQPFLENAVIHGNWQRGEGAVVRVAFEQCEAGGSKQLCVTVTDNGCGLPEGFSVQSTKGIGIRNVVDRIQLYCGPKYGVQVSSSTQDGGTQVIIRLPLVSHKEEMEQLTRSLIHENDSLSG